MKARRNTFRGSLLRRTGFALLCVVGTLRGDQSPAPLYVQNFENTAPDKLPDGIMLFGGTAAVKKVDGNGVLEMAPDPLESHGKWVNDINETQSTTVNFPILADADRKVANLYDMIHPNALSTGPTATVRSVFIIDPKKVIRTTFTYPASTGRNFDEILRVIDSLQLTDGYKVATPVNWKDGDDVIIVPSLQDPAELAQRFPKGFKAVKPYLRITPQPNK